MCSHGVFELRDSKRALLPPSASRLHNGLSVEFARLRHIAPLRVQSSPRFDPGKFQELNPVEGSKRKRNWSESEIEIRVSSEGLGNLSCDLQDGADPRQHKLTMSLSGQSRCFEMSAMGGRQATQGQTDHVRAREVRYSIVTVWSE